MPQIVEVTLMGNRHIPTVQFGNVDLQAAVKVTAGVNEDPEDVLRFAQNIVNRSLEMQKEELDTCVRKDFEVKV